jgi:hypothetical protein
MPARAAVYVDQAFEPGRFRSRPVTDFGGTQPGGGGPASTEMTMVSMLLLDAVTEADFFHFDW